MRVVLLLGGLLVGVLLPAQRIETRLICHWVPGSVPRDAGRAKYPAQPGRQLAENITLLTFTDAATAEATRAILRRNPAVRSVQYDWKVTFRSTPNDPLYASQSNLRRSGFEAAWDLTTGGTTPDGTPIVTAVLDGGFDVDHEDLRASLWTNAAEIPGDGVDNDGNGLVDDLHGWDYAAGSGSLGTDTHGTQVAGIIGARGDNDTGVAGTNWQSQLMLFTIATVSDIIAAYGYIIEQRSLHLRSAGQQGALVVATNASFGIEGATCADFPVWGDMYDRLGEAGILTAASVVNLARDVDLAGDMPTDCPSEFLLGVTNVDTDDRLFPSAGYGSEHVDLGAPGEGSYTTRPGNRYGSFGSTSAAAPYVTGAISLLYASPCPLLHQLARGDPPAAALLVRKSLLASVDESPSLQFRTSSGGRLNVAAAQRELLRYCTVEKSGNLEAVSVYPSPTSGSVRIITNAATLAEVPEVEVYDALGRRVRRGPTVLTSIFPVTVEADLAGLPGGWYLLRLRSDSQRASIPVLVR
nr:S8 family peptidase [Lewinella sp. JB7]